MFLLPRVKCSIASFETHKRESKRVSGFFLSCLCEWKSQEIKSLLSIIHPAAKTSQILKCLLPQKILIIHQRFHQNNPYFSAWPNLAVPILLGSLTLQERTQTLPPTREEGCARRHSTHKKNTCRVSDQRPISSCIVSLTVGLWLGA